MVAGRKLTLRERYKALRKRILSLTPFVRRSRHERVVARTEWHWRKYVESQRHHQLVLGSLAFSPPRAPDTAAYVVRVPLRHTPAEELCLFVTHAGSPQLKPHVVDHIQALLDAGVEILLIANTDVEFAKLEVPTVLAGRLYGYLIRENVGFDFAAWAHAYSLLDPALIRRRLYLINDSIVGPLDIAAYGRLIQRIRESAADLLGLTRNPDPHSHLQSFYLVFNERVVHSSAFDTLMKQVRILPSKQAVIDSYEVWLAPRLEQEGFVSAAIFPNLSKLPPPDRNDTIFAWRELIAHGFPFVKSVVLRDPNQEHAARRFLPERYR